MASVFDFDLKNSRAVAISAMLDDKKKESRYSLAYLYAMCSQAGYTTQETRQDEDIEAIDAWVFVRVVNRHAARC
jgi:hypothetical protein